MYVFVHVSIQQIHVEFLLLLDIVLEIPLNKTMLQSVER